MATLLVAVEQIASRAQNCLSWLATVKENQRDSKCQSWALKVGTTHRRVSRELSGGLAAMENGSSWSQQSLEVLLQRNG